MNDVNLKAMVKIGKELDVKSNKTFVGPDSTYGGLPTTFHARDIFDSPRTEITEQDKYNHAQ